MGEKMKKKFEKRIDHLDSNKLFDELRFHPLIIRSSGSLFKSGHYSQAIFEAYKAINNYVKEKSGRGKLDGKDLMAKVFREDNPIIKLNELKTTSDKDEQEGFKFLFMGAMVGIRNPKAHDSIIHSDPIRALEYLSFASLLMRRIDEGIVTWKISQITESLEQKTFIKESEYVDALLQKLPSNQYKELTLQLIDMYLNSHITQNTKLNCLFLHGYLIDKIQNRSERKIIAKKISALFERDDTILSGFKLLFPGLLEFFSDDLQKKVFHLIVQDVSKGELSHRGHLSGAELTKFVIRLRKDMPEKYREKVCSSLIEGLESGEWVRQGFCTKIAIQISDIIPYQTVSKIVELIGEAIIGVYPSVSAIKQLEKYLHILPYEWYNLLLQFFNSQVDSEDKIETIGVLKIRQSIEWLSKILASKEFDKKLREKIEHLIKKLQKIDSEKPMPL